MPPERPQRQQGLRRVDWRFLLPSPRLGSVAVLGRPDQELLAGLSGIAERLTGDPAAGAVHDLVVVAGPTRSDLTLAARLVRPGGWVYAEIDRRAASRDVRSSRACARALQQLGFAPVGRHWHWPSFEACLEIVDLDAPGSVSMSLARRQASRSSRAKASLAGALRRLRALDLAVPCASVLGRKAAGPDAETGWQAMGPLARPGPRETLERAGLGPGAELLLVTPRFETSRAVVALVAPAGRAEPRLVAKIARARGAGSAIERETRCLLAVAASRAGELHTVPEVVWSGELDGCPALVTTALTGSLVNPRFVARRRQAVVEAGLAWTLGLPRSAPCRAEERVARLVDGPLAALAGALPDDGLLERTRQLLEPLRDALLPVVFEHGDVSHPNLFWLPGNRLGVIDWELAEPEGLPVIDLAFFLAYVASAGARATTPEEHRRAFEVAFRAGDGWALEVAERYARAAAVPEEAIAPLLVACFARYTAGVARRAAAGAEQGAAAAGEPAGSIGLSRPYALWQAALALACA